ncbi:NYN domain-containing protein [Camelliibacillus cellulosilyticus]|uniref:NYN domain-containing protein n=1 Tax=Camelliibacillus cellulosilyticus TaxID=2174486 RepID=A0ABV9GUB0_9BACL
MNVLLVDGYNIIGAWPELTQLKSRDLAAARDRLVDQLAEYQAFTGWRVIVIFDAYLVPGAEYKTRQSKVEVIFTRENETADERIEKLVKELKNVRTTVYVATSDYAEQQTIFSQGALRKSARELYLDIQNINQQITATLNIHKNKQKKSSIFIDEELTKLFEIWRRGK